MPARKSNNGNPSPEHLAKLNQELGGVDMGTREREPILKRRAGTFMLLDDMGDEHALGNEAHGVIVGAATVRVLFQDGIPRCQAHGDNHWTPHVDNPMHPTCRGCPYNAKGGDNCVMQKKLAVLPIVNGAFEDKPHAMFLKGLAFGDFIRAQKGVKDKGVSSLAAVVTKFHEKNYKTDKFGMKPAIGLSYVRHVHPDEITTVLKAVEDAKPLLAAPPLQPDPNPSNQPQNAPKGAGGAQDAIQDDADLDDIPF